MPTGAGAQGQSGNQAGPTPAPALTLLYDGGCPLCLREVTFLRRRDRRLHGHQPRLAFVDIDAADYDPAAHGGISYREAMGRIHAIDAEGRVLQDLAVFQQAYALVRLGWLYAPTGWPLLGSLAAAAYGLWARLRLPLTGRPGLDQLCDRQADRCRIRSHRPRESSGATP